MARIDFHRAAYQRPDPNIMCGKRRAVATPEEASRLMKCRDLLKEAATTTSETTFNYNVSEVMRQTKTITINHLKIEK